MLHLRGILLLLISVSLTASAAASAASTTPKVPHNRARDPRHHGPYTSTSLWGIRGGAASSSTLSKPIKLTPPSPLKSAIAGGVATAIGDILLHPIDCVKTLQQGAGLSFFGAASKIFKTTGPAGFYSGLGAYVTADGGAGCLKFATYEVLKTWTNDHIPERYRGSALFGCAALAFLASSVVLVPGELIKQRLQMGMVDSVPMAVKSIWKSGGVGGFFAGASGVWMRDIPYTMLELGIYDNVKGLCTKARKGEESSRMDELVAAIIAGGVTGFLTNPMDVVKTKMMLSETGMTFAAAFRSTVKEGGVARLFNGSAARVGYILPFCAFYLPLYEVIKRKL